MRKIHWILLLTVIFVSCGDSPGTLAEYEEAGREAYLRKDYVKAKDLLGKAAAMKSSNREVLYYLGLTYQREYYLDSAIFYLKRADLLHPGDREINLVLYPLAAELKEWELAARALMVLVVTGDPIENYREQLADLNVKMGNYVVAYIHAKELVRLEPDNPERYFQAAVLANQNDSIESGLRFVNEAIDKFDQDERFLPVKGMLLVSKGDYAAAEKILRPICEADSSIQNKLNLAFALAEQEARPKKEEAYRLFLDVRQLVGNQPYVDSTIAKLETALGQN